MITSEMTYATLFKKHNVDVDVEVWLRTDRMLSEAEARTLNDMIHEMALTVDRIVCDGNKKG